MIAQDAVVERNRELLLARSNVGLGKYGVTLADAGLDRKAILQHALEEALDLANYLQTEIMRLEGAEREAEDLRVLRSGRTRSLFNRALSRLQRVARTRMANRRKVRGFG